MSEGDVALDEKRIYGETREVTVTYVAGELGVTRVAVSGDRVGRVGLVHRGAARDVAGGDGQLLVATDADALVGTGDGFEPTGFGPAAAVGVGRDLLAAAPDGRVARLVGDDWHAVGTVEDPRAFDADYLAAGSGVFRAGTDGLEALGAAGVRDVAAAGATGAASATSGAGSALRAATDDGLFRLDADGRWTVEREEACEVVAAADDRAHLVAAGTLFERRDGEWVACQLPADGEVVDVAYGEAPYAVTADGTFLIDAAPGQAPDGAGGWRGRALGVPGVAGIAVP